MNKTLTSLLIKFITTFVITWISFTMFAYSTFGYILIVSVAVTLFGFLGDKILVPRFGNITATISDGVFAVIVSYFIALVFDGLVANTLTFIVYALLTGISEYFFHRYLINNDEEVETTPNRNIKPSYNMETSEEFDDRERNTRRTSDHFYNDTVDDINEETDNLLVEASNEFNERVLDEVDSIRTHKYQEKNQNDSSE